MSTATPTKPMLDESSTGRRTFLKAGVTVAALAALPVWATARRSQAEGETPPPAPKPTGEGDRTAEPSAPGAGKLKHLIIISLQGGPSHLDTFDPKTPDGFKGPFAPIETAIKGVSFTEVLPGLAKRAGDLCVVRGMTSAEGNHDRARYLTLTGQVPNPSVKHPSLGCMLAKEFEQPDQEMPQFIAIGGPTVDAGYLGPQYAPLLVNDPERGLDNLRYRKGVSAEQEKSRLERRLRLRGEVDKEFKKERNEDIADDQKAMYDKAKKLMDSKKAAAFDLTLEDKSARDLYTRTKLGQSLLLARRLIEQGVKCVEVRLNGWDTHDNHADRISALCGQLDPAMSGLIDDLKKRKMFGDTGVACYGEFGRTPKLDNGRNGRGHYPRAWSMVLAGGPFARGRVVGETDGKGERVVSGAVTVPDFFRSMAHAAGVDPLRQFHVNERPIWYVDKAGKLAPALFA
jgi:hypothetical protein